MIDEHETHNKKIIKSHLHCNVIFHHQRLHPISDWYVNYVVYNKISTDIVQIAAYSLPYKNTVYCKITIIIYCHGTFILILIVLCRVCPSLKWLNILFLFFSFLLLQIIITQLPCSGESKRTSSLRQSLFLCCFVSFVRFILYLIEMRMYASSEWIEKWNEFFCFSSFLNSMKCVE